MTTQPTHLLAERSGHGPARDGACVPASAPAASPLLTQRRVIDFGFGTSAGCRRG
ncbi:hypothetical protein [Actinacidiphila guanduensis]|uniref:hypothetical protein n=1 Tax=Actinacidiphila guanduensis TaxID=310781 RepID=UPI0015A200BF|nr:hypothetical protein [Actinacidiphila guanduensis]